MNVLQRLVHGGGAFLFTVNQVDLALSAAGVAEIVEQFVVVGVAGYAAYSAWLHAELKKNGVAAEAVVYQFEYSSDWADDFPTEECYVCYRFTAADGRVYKGKTQFTVGEKQVDIPGKIRVGGPHPARLSYKKGSRIPVLYQADNPDCHIVNTMEQEWGSRAVLVLVSLAAFALSGYVTRYALGYHEKKHREKGC
ncbi:MAG: DUF3592 domain-containing protein [Akkermansia sp.]|nr:DUF3592 domain-containing protein [Akkermansia sp.]